MESVRPIHPWVAEGSRRVRFATVGYFLPEWKDIVRFAQRAEELGFDAYWANDHPNRSMDCWTLLTALAGETERLRLISLVSCIYYRSPYLLARQAADVDRVSNGRLVLGIGIGDDVPEFNQMCLPFPPVSVRQRAMEETLDILEGLWQGGPFTYTGEHLQVRAATLSPRPVQQPHIPILIGGGGERVTLRQVATRADASNFSPHEWSGAAYEPADVKRKYEALRRHCAEIGRPYDSVLRSHFTPLLTLAEDEHDLERKRKRARIPDPELRSVPLFATTSQAVTHFQALADLGVQYFLAAINGRDDETVDLLATKVIPAIRLGSVEGS
jgi:alkanesulfonate monooxygenase SsuD/methylene tetrahydromethanopterin reductase-like flavin-dependent oxidoreductase (luciferase family)